MPRTKRGEFAVIGLGRFGRQVALTMKERGCSVLGIDQDPAIVQKLSDCLTQTVALDSTDEAALSAVDIAEFRTVVVAIGTHFEANLMTLVALKSLSIVTVICKANTERQKEILLKVGADSVVLPESEAGRRLALGLTSPGMIDPLEFGPKHSVAEFKVPHAMTGLTMREAGIQRDYRVHVLAARRAERVTPTPPADYVLTHEDVLLVMGTNVELVRLADQW